MEAAWGFLGAIVGAFVTQVFNLWLDARRTKAQEAERERDRTHERDLRKLELDEAHRARLYDDRKAAYADFYRSYHEYQRSLEDAGYVRRIAGRFVHQPRPPDEIVVDRLRRVLEARVAMDERLKLIELAASPAVRDAASELRERASNAEPVQMRIAAEPVGLDFREYSAVLISAYEAAEDGERLLREAIQVELELGR
jgi:hypothetical protein